MRSFKYFVGTALLSVASVGLFVACGDDPDDDGDICVLDTDCEGDLVCEGEVCVPTCMADEDCPTGETCESRQNGEGMVCAPSSGVSCADEAEPNAYCVGELGEGAFCDTATGECVLPEEQVFIAQIADVTTTAGACEGTGDPGSDIQGIELRDNTGNTLGWGNLVAEGVVEDGNDELNYGILNGDAPALDGDGCVDTFSGNVLALGCTGYVAVEFHDENDAPIPLEDGQTIVVYEYGGICSTGTTDDEWSVFTCSDTAQVTEGDVSSCNNTLGSGAGVGTVGVTL